MTRINVGIPPAELNVKHLIAEHREIKRIPNMIRRGRYSLLNAPEKFKLGSGHVKFFYNKLAYLKRRYEEIYKECCIRGYSVTYYGECWEKCPPELFGDWNPTTKDINLIRARLKEKEKEK